MKGIWYVETDFMREPQIFEGILEGYQHAGRIACVYLNVDDSGYACPYQVHANRIYFSKAEAESALQTEIEARKAWKTE